MRLSIVLPFFIYLAVVLLFAFKSRKVMQQQIASGKSFLEEYFVAGRSLGGLVLAFSFLATFASAGTFIGYPGFAYKNGLTVIMTGINQITMVFLTMGLIGKRIGMIGRRTGAITFTDILRNRFDHPLVVIGVVMAILVFFTGFMIGQFAGAARILEAVAGVPYKVGVFIFAFTVIIYTTVGGFRAVAWTDTVQGIVMAMGLILVFPAFVVLGGGFTKITTGLLDMDPALVFAPGPKEWLHPGMLLSFWCLWVWISVANPATVKRFLVFKDSASLHRALIVGSIVAAIFYIPMFYMGAGIKTIYPGIHPDQAIPNTYINALPGLIAGLALAAPFAAVMSTVDSLLLVMASALVRDVYQNYINKKASEKTLHGLTYGSTVGIGLIVLIFVYYPPELIAKWIIYFGGGVTAAFLVPVLSALYWKRATTAGAICSIFGGFALFVVLDNVAKNPLHIMSYVWGVLFALILMVVVSHLTKPQSKEVIELYFGPAKGEVSNS